MDILVDKSNDSVTFTLPNGVAVEITMVKVFGEDILPLNDVTEAFLILRDELNYLNVGKVTSKGNE